MSQIDEQQETAISAELDAMACELFGEGLDRLANGIPVNILLAVQYVNMPSEAFEFAEDGEEECLAAAYEQIERLKNSCEVQSFALVYDGAIECDNGDYADALLMEFGEKNTPTYSAYALYLHAGEPDVFAWTEPAAAGESESLL